MALSDPIYLAAYGSSPGASSFVTPSVTVTTGDLVVIMVSSRTDARYISSVTQATWTAGAWNVPSGGSTTYGSNSVTVSYAYCQVTAGGSGAITVTLNASAAQTTVCHVYRVPAGFNTTTPIRQAERAFTTTLAEMNTNDNITGTFGLTPLVTSALITFAAGNPVNNGLGPLSGWTIGHDNGGGELPTSSEVDSASTSTTYGVQNLYADQTAVVVALGIEIQEATAGGPSIPILTHHIRQQS